jgi:peptidoglycan hydrolase-like protein with peptidoglycan-binding domain
MVNLPQRSDSSVKSPSATAGFPNGKIPGEHLVPCGLKNGPNGSPNQFLMVEPAASAMRAMVAAAAASGVVLATNGTWRSYAQQADLFTSRFSRTARPGKYKTWDGHRWWPIGNYKVWSAATPGTSNHGKGLAADLTKHDYKTGITDVELRWLADHGPGFGFWNTVKGERFHWTYCLADGVTTAVGEAPSIAPPANPDWDAIAKLDKELSAVEYPGPLKRGGANSKANKLAVRALQWKLHAAGYGIDVDGSFGTNTFNALKIFEQSNGLPVDGEVDAVVWGRLGLAGGAGLGTPPLDGLSISPPNDEIDAGAFTAPFGLGSSGPGVEAVQSKLASNGYTVESNGQFGPRTEKAVTHFQKVNGRKENGVVDAELWTLLGLP